MNTALLLIRGSVSYDLFLIVKMHHLIDYFCYNIVIVTHLLFGILVAEMNVISVSNVL